MRKIRNEAAYQKIFSSDSEELVEVSESDRCVRSEGVLGVGVRWRLLAPASWEEGRLHRHEVLHQQVAFLELGEAETVKCAASS